MASFQSSVEASAPLQPEEEPRGEDKRAPLSSSLWPECSLDPRGHSYRRDTQGISASPRLHPGAGGGQGPHVHPEATRTEETSPLGLSLRAERSPGVGPSRGGAVMAASPRNWEMGPPGQRAGWQWMWGLEMGEEELSSLYCVSSLPLVCSHERDLR